MDGVLHKALKVVVRPLQECDLKGFLVQTREVVEWECVSLLVSHSYGIFDSKDMLEVRHSVVVKRPFARGMVTGEYLINGRMASERLLKNTTMVRRGFMATPTTRTLKFRDENDSVEDGEVDSGRGLL